MAQYAIESYAEHPGAALRGNATCVAAIALFATGFPAAEALLQTWGPISLIAARVVLACALLMPLWVMFDGWRQVLNAPWRRALTIGALGFGTGTIMLLVTQDMTNPVTAALVAATMPVSAVALEIILDGRRLTRNFLAGLALVLIGGVMATGADLGGAEFGMGVFIGFLASMLFAWGSRKTVKGLPEMTRFGQITLTLIGAMLLCLATLAVFLAFGWSGTEVAVLDARGWSMLLIYSWGAMAISQVFWIFGVARLGVAVASFHLNAAPFYVMLILLAAGGDWDWAKALGAAVLAAGVVLAQRRRCSVWQEPGSPGHRI